MTTINYIMLYLRTSTQSNNNKKYVKIIIQTRQ